jgi:hypothetical protein
MLPVFRAGNHARAGILEQHRNHAYADQAQQSNRTK